VAIGVHGGTLAAPLLGAQAILPARRGSWSPPSMILSEDLECSVNTPAFCEYWRAEKPVAARATGSPTGENREKSPDEKKSLPFFAEKPSELPKIAAPASGRRPKGHKQRL
jgi:hypothetical protein